MLKFNIILIFLCCYAISVKSNNTINEIPPSASEDELWRHYYDGLESLYKGVILNFETHEFLKRFVDSTNLWKKDALKGLIIDQKNLALYIIFSTLKSPTYIYTYCTAVNHNANLDSTHPDEKIDFYFVK